MKIAIITIGPQGAGKSWYSEERIAENPDWDYVSRDQIMKELLGPDCMGFNPYTNEHLYVFKEMWERVAAAAAGECSALILDCFNMGSAGRKNLCEKLRLAGFGIIIGWQFITPMKLAVDQLIRRGGGESWTRSFMERDFKHYWEDLPKIEDGFDSLIEVDPRQLRLKI